MVGNEFDYKMLSIVAEMIPHLNQNGLFVIEKRYSNFIHVLKERSKKADVSWQTVIKGLDFYEENISIEKFLDNEVGKSVRK